MKLDKNTVNDIVKYAYDNPKETATIIVAIGTVFTTILRLTQTIAINNRCNSYNKTYYDQSTKIRWDLKRKLTNNENQLIHYRKKHGEEIYDILKSMNLLK